MLLQLLGLQLEKYVPDDQKLREKSWAGVVQNETTLEQMLRSHVLLPLLQAAEELPIRLISCGAAPVDRGRRCRDI